MGNDFFAFSLECCHIPLREILATPLITLTPTLAGTCSGICANLLRNVEDIEVERCACPHLFWNHGYAIAVVWTPWQLWVDADRAVSIACRWTSGQVDATSVCGCPVPTPRPEPGLTGCHALIVTLQACTDMSLEHVTAKRE